MILNQLEIPIPVFSWNMKVWVGHNSEKAKGKTHIWHLFVAGDCGFATRFIQQVQHKQNCPQLFQVEVKLPSTAAAQLTSSKKIKKKTKADSNNNNNHDKDDEEEWQLMDGEGEGIFELRIQVEFCECF